MKTIKYRVVATKQESLIPENVHAYLGKHPDTTGEIDPDELLSLLSGN